MLGPRTFRHALTGSLQLLGTVAARALLESSSVQSTYRAEYNTPEYRADCKDTTHARLRIHHHAQEQSAGGWCRDSTDSALYKHSEYSVLYPPAEC